MDGYNVNLNYHSYTLGKFGEYLWTNWILQSRDVLKLGADTILMEHK